jgi:hemolysin D
VNSIDVSARAPAVTPKQTRIKADVRDRAFLPAAVEIIETPPAPGAVWLTLAICCFVVAALAWCWVGRLDIYATARGKIEPQGHAKVIGPADSGKVANINVVEGQKVHSGDVLLALDISEPEAEFAAATQAIIAATAEAARRQAALATVASGDWANPAAIDWPPEIPALVRSREEGVLRGDLRGEAATIASLQAQKREKEATVAQLDGTIVAEKQLLETLQERVALKQELIDNNVGTKTGLIDAVQSLRQAQTQLSTDTGKRAEAAAAVSSLDAKLHETVTTFVSDQTRDMVKARRLADEKTADRLKAKIRIDRMTLRSPVDGTVQNLAVTTLGQVVSTGQELMHILPSDTPIDVQAYVTNDDIGFITPGQAAVVKIDSFPYTRYGTIDAVVEQVADDAIPADTANRTLSDPTKISQTGTQSLTPTAKPTTDLVFLTRLKLSANSIMVNGREVPLTPGMTVTVEVKTGNRRILDYLFSPLVEVASKAMRER